MTAGRRPCGKWTCSDEHPLMPMCAAYPPDMFSIRQVTAVRGAFSLAGYDGDLRTLPIASEDERVFVLAQSDVLALRDVRTLEQVLQQVLGRKVWVVDSIEDDTIPFA